MRPVVKPLLAVVLALAGGAAAVLDDDQPPARATAADASAPDDTAAPGSEPASGSDGILTIGVLLPRTGEGAVMIPAAAAVDLAVNAINQSGGVFGENVRLVPTDEGNTMEQAGAAVDELLASDVDAVVGPASSLVALEYLDELVDAGVLTCSPSATALALDDFPDDGLFFRTVPSDSLAAVALGFLAEQTGVSTATVVYVDDAFGRPFARAVMDNLRQRRQIEVLDEVPLTPGDTDYSDEVELLANAEATGTIVVVAASNVGWSFLSELATVLPDPPDIVVNDALRRPPAPEIVQQLPEEFRSAIVGFSPLAILGPDVEPAGAYAPQAFNCVNTIALAAVAAGSDVPGDIADQIQSVTSVGRACAQFEECIAMQSRGLDVNYEGPANLLRELGDNGDPDRAVFETFRFGADGVDLAGEIGSVSE